MKTKFTFLSVLAVLFTAALTPVDVAKAVSVFEKGPYLQQVTTNSIVIMWETDVASGGQVDYGFSAPSEFTKTGSIDDIHEIELTGLTPGSVYYYTVTSGDVTSDPNTFTTAPASEEPFRFVAYGNTRSNDIDHRKVILAIIDSAPNLVIHTGDLVLNGNDYDQWGEQFFGPCYDLMINTPLLPVLGNHEESGSWFFEFFSLPNNEQWFAFTYGGVRFIGLDTNVDYFPGSDQSKWLLETEFNSSAYKNATWHIVYFHHPPYTCTSGHSDDTDVQQDLVPLFEQYGVDMVFNGHSHVYEMYLHNGIYYIVTGGGGAPLHGLLDDEQEPIRQVGFTTLHHCVIDVTSTSLILEALDNDRYSLDTITIARTLWASNRNPEDGATNVPVDTVLSWRAGIDAVSHDVYFGTNYANVEAGTGETFQGTQEETTTFNPDTLDYETTYYWRIDEFDGLIMHEGYVWSFTTEAPPLPWSDRFESGSFAAGGWTTSGNASVSSKADYSGTYGAEIKGTSWIEKAVSTVSFSNINIKCVCKTKGLDYGEYLYIEWHDGSDGSPWNLLKYIQSTDWSLQNLTCETGANDNADFKVRFRTNGSNSAEYAYVDDVWIGGTPSGPDETAPTPDPMTWAVAPYATGSTSISMTATTASDPSGVEYSFECTAGGGNSSGWQDDPVYQDTGLSPSVTYTYRVNARDKSANLNETGLSTEESATTTESGGGTMHVESIAMEIVPPTGKKYSATATVEIFHALEMVEGATVVGDWYFKGVLRLSGATGVTGADGKAVLTSFETPAKTGDTFTFTVTDVAKSGWIYDPSGETSGSIAVP